MKLKLIEPLKDLFKDEVRKIGRDLGMPEEILQRQPFPGPGLAVRILGEVTPERVALLQEADDIVVGEIKRAGLYTKIWQSFAVLLPVMSVGVMGDMRTYAYTCAIRAVNSEDGMTADWVDLPHEVLKTISNRIVNEVKGINRVVYDVTSSRRGRLSGSERAMRLYLTQRAQSIADVVLAVVTSLTLWVVVKYAADTKTIAENSTRQLESSQMPFVALVILTDPDRAGNWAIKNWVTGPP